MTTLRRRSSNHASILTVEKCEALIKTIDRHRDPSLINLAKCITVYNLSVALSTLRGMDHPSTQIEMSKAMAMTGHIVHYDMPQLPMLKKELLKRLYWLLFAANW